MKVIKEYKPCGYFKGTELEWDGEYSADCRTFQGYGEVIETVYKDVNMDELELPTGRE